MFHRNLLRDFIYMMDEKSRLCGDCIVCRKHTSKLQQILQDEVKHETKTKIFTPIGKEQYLYTPINNEYLYTPIKSEQYSCIPIRNEQCTSTLKRKHIDSDTPSTEKRMKESYVDQPIKIEPEEEVINCNTSSQISPLKTDSKYNNTVDTERHEREVEKAKYERNIKLYQFLIDLLEDNDPCVTWITRDNGMFKIIDSDRFAKLWGEVKLNPTMNYEKLARSFRHYYKKGIMESDSTISKTGKRKLYYKFGGEIIKTYMKTGNI